MKNFKELLLMTNKVLYEELLLLKRELMNVRFALKMGSFQNTARLSILKKQAARIQTIIHNRA